jgi:7-keto-8-aminopelargonate synthetase-like enzyme
MDGDIAPLREISALTQEYDALLMVDEAHATGVAGESGGGVVEALGLRDKVEVQLGTFSKALGSLGGYVAGSSNLIALLLNKARSFIFTTALPPAVLAASLEALRIARTESNRRETLRRHSCKLRSELKALGFTLGPTESQIIPIMVGDDRLAIAACRYLLRQGVYVQGIRPPTVPQGTARLRVAPMAIHTNEQIDAALQAFARLADILKRRRN